MGTIWLKEFLGGLDTRRMPETTPGGVLIEAVDGHITEGGEFESRASFVKAYTLPSGTVGLGHTRSNIIAFGSIDEPSGMPSGVGYQKLAPPAGTTLVSVPSYDLYSGLVYAAGVFSDGTRVHYYNGTEVEDWFDGRARASIEVTGGTGASQLTAMTVDGVAIISGAVTWATSNENTAQLIADEINSTVSTPDYTALAVGATLVVTAADPGTEANGRLIVTTVASALVLTPASGVVLAGGAAAGSTFQPGTFVRTIRSKMYSVSSANMHFSGIGAPTGWTTDNVGAGFVDMSSWTSGSEELTALGNYQGSVAVFADNVVQLWYVDPDPALNRQTQELKNTGTIAPQSVTEFGDSDLFYLAISGLRSLRARDSSNAAATTDIGSPIDGEIAATLSTMTATEIANAIGLIEPRDNRFWLLLKGRIFVFSYFAGAKVSAWSEYTPIDADGVAFTVDQAIVYNRRVYIRSGDDIYVYGGLGADRVYDDIEAVARTPYLDADRPTTGKQFLALDVAATGVWTVYVALNPLDTTARDKVGTIDGTTYGLDKWAGLGNSTHISLIFKSKGTGPHNLGACVIRHDLDDDED